MAQNYDGARIAMDGWTAVALREHPRSLLDGAMQACGRNQRWIVSVTAPNGNRYAWPMRGVTVEPMSTQPTAADVAAALSWAMEAMA